MTDSEKKLMGIIAQKYEASSYRYMDAENFLITIMEMPWYKRIFLGKKILKFLKQQSEKYDSILSNEW